MGHLFVTAGNKLRTATFLGGFLLAAAGMTVSTSAAPAVSGCSLLAPGDVEGATSLLGISILPKTSYTPAEEQQMRSAFRRAERALKASIQFPGDACGREAVERELRMARDELANIPADPTDAAARKDQQEQRDKLRTAIKNAITRILEGKAPVGWPEIRSAVDSGVLGEGTDWAKAALLDAISSEQARVASIPGWAESTERSEYERILRVRTMIAQQGSAVNAYIAHAAADRAERERLIQGIDEFHKFMEAQRSWGAPTPLAPISDLPAPPLTVTSTSKMTGSPPGAIAPSPTPSQGPVQLAPPR